MKKKLNILETIALTTTASTSVIACGGKEETKSSNPPAVTPPEAPQGTTDEPKPVPVPQTQPGGTTAVTKTNISNKIKNNIITLGQLSEKKASEFLNKLNKELKKISTLKNITTSDYVVYKVGSKNPIADNDIIADKNIISLISLKIKIVAKSNNFEGEKDNIEVRY